MSETQLTSAGSKPTNKQTLQRRIRKNKIPKTDKHTLTNPERTDYTSAKAPHMDRPKWEEDA